MIEDNEEPHFSLRARLRAQLLTHLFKDVYRNLNKVEYFYSLIYADKMELQFMSLSHDILITVILQKQVFQMYDFNADYSDDSLHIHKYFLEEFSYLGDMF